MDSKSWQTIPNGAKHQSAFPILSIFITTDSMSPCVVCEHLCRYKFTEDGFLHIPSAQVTDTGRYLCMATNQAGTQRKTVDLQVYGGCSSCTN